MRRHWPFAVVLGAAAFLRVAASVSYWPALFYSDSWGYLSMAHGPGIVTFAPLRPSGYPLILEILPDHLGTVTTLQHLAGLATGTLAYALLVRLGVHRLLATAAAAVVLLDAWAIALEQHILAEAFFTLAIAGAVFLTLWRERPRAWELAAAGVLLAGASLMRPVGLAAAAVWLLWVILRRLPARTASAGAVAFVVPVVVYCAGHAASTGTFGLTEADGWFLYGRVGEIAQCDELDTRSRLCTRTAGEGPNFWIFNRRSPARRVYRRIDGESNAAVREFAVDVIRERPGEYARIVARDFLKYLRPGPTSRYREDSTIEFPDERPNRFDEDPVRERLYPELDVAYPANRLLKSGQPLELIHTSRVLIALLLVASLATLALRKGEKRTRSAIALTLAMAVAMLLATSMTAGFALRYLVPEVVLAVVSGTLAVQALGRVVGVRAES